MCNTCNTCGCNNGYDPLLAALTNLFTPIGCGCGNNGGNLYLVQNLGTVTPRSNNGCGCGNSGNGYTPTSGCGCGQNNGCGCGQNNGCGNTYDAYYVRQYALCGCGCNN